MRLGVVRPAIFGTYEYARGNAQARNNDGSVNGAQHPAARRGSVVTLYTTALRAMGLPVEVHAGGRAAK